MTRAVSAFVVGTFLLVTFGLQQQAVGQQPAQPPKDRTTQIQADMNPRQRYHSQQFAKYRTQTRLLDQKRSVRISVDRTGGPPRPVDDILRELTCAADAVFTASAHSIASMPIDDGTFLFSDYEVVIDRTFRMPDIDKSPRPGIVTRPGGMWLFRDDGAKVSAMASGFPFLGAGRPYLFFTKYLPVTRTFKTEEPRGVFDLGTWNLRGDLAGQTANAKSLVSISTTSGDLSETGINRDDLFQKLSDVSCR